MGPAGPRHGKKKRPLDRSCKAERLRDQVVIKLKFPRHVSCDCPRPMRTAGLLLFASILAANADQTLQGRWEGIANIPGMELQLTVDLDNQASGWTGAVTIPQLGLKGAELSDIQVKGSEFDCAIKTALADKQAGPARIKGHLSGEGKLTGDFLQAGNTAPVSLSKVGPPQIELAPRSTSIAKEFEGVWKGGYELLGYPRRVTLTLRNPGEAGATAEFVIVGRKENILPVDLITQHGSFLSVNSTETGLSFEGQLENHELQGTILQGPLEIAVTLQHAN